MNKNEVLIVCALEVETQHQLVDWNVLYTGVGKINATMNLVDRFTDYNYVKPKLVINYGTAGSQSNEYIKGDLVDCTRFIQRDMDVSGLGFKEGQTPFEDDIPIILQSESEFNPIGKKVLCGSGDSFVQNKTIGDVVDMESYALAKVCHGYNIPFISFKYITDDANGDAGNDWEENVGKGIVKFKQKILNLLK